MRLDRKNQQALGPFHTVQRAKDNNSLPKGINGEKYSTDPRWEASDIERNNWNGIFPYELKILKYEGGRWVEESNFTLPIPPQEMSIQTQYAVSVTATLGGILEENNGVVFKNISFSGSTGVYPLKGSGDQYVTPGALEGIFAGTINAAKGVATTASSILGKKYDFNLIPEGLGFAAYDDLKGTGYYQFHLLQRFLEGYAYIKKMGGSNYRLSLVLHKDNEAYFVTPIAFNLQRSSASPLEYVYALQLKAWRRTPIDLGQVASAAESQYTTKNDASVFDRIRDGIDGVRETIQAAQGVLDAVRSDLASSIFDVVRQVSLAATDALDLSVSVVDFPAQIINDASGAIGDVMKVPSKALEVERNFRSVGSTYRAELDKFQKKLDYQDNWSTAPTDSRDQLDQIDSYQTGGGSELPSPLLNGMSESQLRLTPALSAKIKEEKRRVRELTRTDYERMKDTISSASSEFASAVGASDPAFDYTYGARAPHTVLHSVPTSQDYEVLYALETMSKLLDDMIISKSDSVKSNPVEYIGGLATRSGIAFTQPTSKYGVPFPYGSTLERLSARYLGSSDRWHEIAALNGLVAPYVDEEGVDYSLLVNGSEDQVVIQYTDDLYVGQPVWVGSNVVPRTKRTIRSLERTADTLAVTLDGERDMDRFSTLALASLHAYLPNTINSQQLIYLPSSAPAAETGFRTDKIPTYGSTDALIKVAGVDLLLTSDMDLVITGSGDGMWAMGTTNLVQRLKIGMATPKGGLMLHPDYGMSVPVGSSLADLSVNEVAQSIKDFIAADSAFSGVSSLAVSQNGPGMQIAATVGVRGVAAEIPITTTVKR